MADERDELAALLAEQEEGREAADDEVDGWHVESVESDEDERIEIITASREIGGGRLFRVIVTTFNAKGEAVGRSVSLAYVP